jgi:hypothetical protein
LPLCYHILVSLQAGAFPPWRHTTWERAESQQRDVIWRRPSSPCKKRAAPCWGSRYTLYTFWCAKPNMFDGE